MSTERWLATTLRLLSFYIFFAHSLSLQVDGTASNPITIRGAGGTSNRDNVVLRGEGVNKRLFEIMHDFYIIEVRFLATWLGRVCERKFSVDSRRTMVS